MACGYGDFCYEPRDEEDDWEDGDEDWAPGEEPWERRLLVGYDNAEWNGRRWVTGDGNGVIFFEGHPQENFAEDDHSYWEARGGRRGKSFACAYTNMLAQMSREERVVIEALFDFFQSSGPCTISRHELLARLQREGFSYEEDAEIARLMKVMASVSEKATLAVLYDHELREGSILRIYVSTYRNIFRYDSPEIFIYDGVESSVRVDIGTFFS